MIYDTEENKKKNSQHIRVSKNFDKELNDINEIREKNGDFKMSKPKITNLIIKHKYFWKKMKEDLINYEINKRGQSTFMLFLMIFFLFAGILFLFISGVVVININNALDQDIQLGKVNLQTINSQTFGVFASMFINYADWWGLCLIIGLILGLFLSSYFTRNKFPKWGIVLDIFLIFTSFIFSLYISSSYELLINSLNSAGQTFLEDYAPKTSNFMLNLPTYIAIIGSVMMFLFHSSLPEKSEERLNIDGGFQGI